MSLSSEFKDVVEEIEAGFRRIVREEIEKALKSPTLSRSDISKELNRSREWLSRNPWVLPNYGRPDVAGIPELWWRENWEEWKKDLAAHKQEWESMSASERMAVLEIA